MSRLVKPLLALLVAVLVVPVLHPRPGAGAAPRAATVTQTWMVSRSAIDRIDADTGGDGLARDAFDVATTLETGQRQPGWTTRRTVTFTAYGPPSSTSSFEYAVAHHTLPAGTTDVVYDDEDWSLTPHDEQVAPGRYMAEFVSLAHAHGLAAVLAPAVDLARAMPCYSPSSAPWVDYVSVCDIPALAGAAHPDVYEIQSQLYEDGTPLGVECGCYAWLVTQSALEARRYTPAVGILAGLSTNDDGAVSTPQALYDDTVATQASTDGYWLNVPARSRQCPQCSAGGAPQVAVGYLEMLGYAA